VVRTANTGIPMAGVPRYPFTPAATFLHYFFASLAKDIGLTIDEFMEHC